MPERLPNETDYYLPTVTDPVVDRTLRLANRFNTILMTTPGSTPELAVRMATRLNYRWGDGSNPAAVSGYIQGLNSLEEQGLAGSESADGRATLLEVDAQEDLESKGVFSWDENFSETIFTVHSEPWPETVGGMDIEAQQHQIVLRMSRNVRKPGYENEAYVAVVQETCVANIEDVTVVRTDGMSLTFAEKVVSESFPGLVERVEKLLEGAVTTAEKVLALKKLTIVHPQELSAVERRALDFYLDHMTGITDDDMPFHAISLADETALFHPHEQRKVIDVVSNGDRLIKLLGMYAFDKLYLRPPNSHGWPTRRVSHQLELRLMFELINKPPMPNTPPVEVQLKKINFMMCLRDVMFMNAEDPDSIDS